MKKYTYLFGLLLCVVSTASAAPLPSRSLTLGNAQLQEKRTAVTLLPGVVLTTIYRGTLDPAQAWTVNLVAVRTTLAAEKPLSDLRAAGFEGRLDPMQTQDVLTDSLGFMLRVGRFSNRAQAEAALAALKVKGFGGGVQHTAEDGGPSSGPWAIRVLSVAPSAQAIVRAALASDIVPGRETTSALARRLGAVAAVNGGFFVVNDASGTEGDLAGLSVQAGQLISEAIAGRPAFFLDSASLKGSVILEVSSSVTLTANGQVRRASGLNRKPGLISNCGNAVGTPTVLPAHDYTCRSANELIVFTPAFGTSSDAGEGYEVMVEAGGRISAVQSKRGSAIPAGGYTLQATGSEAVWLQQLSLGTPLTLERTVSGSAGAQGDALPLTPTTYAVNGGPTLLMGGKLVNHYAAEGWSPDALGGPEVTEKDPSSSADSRTNFFNGWLLRRNPRTAVGIMKDGTLLFVTVDGRNPTHSVGTSIPETAALMRGLGAVDAMNLDGGGSTATVVNNMLQGVPSDATGERPDGDAIIILPKP